MFLLKFFCKSQLLLLKCSLSLSSVCDVCLHEFSACFAKQLMQYFTLVFGYGRGPESLAHIIIFFCFSYHSVQSLFQLDLLN